MSVIRFLHTDALRLGSPVAGLSECPDWLRKTAASAVRTAVTNVIEAAIAGRCQFLFIAGRLTESEQDLELAVAWLMTQTSSLREHGIRLVIAGHPESDQAILSRLDAIVVNREQRLDAWTDPTGNFHCAVNAQSAPAAMSSLTVEVGAVNTSRPIADLAYVAIPSTMPSPATNSFDGVATAHDRLLRLSAGSPQALTPLERGHFGAQLVEVDLSRQTMTARFCSTDVIRFTQELVRCQPGLHVSQLCDVLRERSRALATSERCTTVVEWVVDGQLAMTLSETESLCEVDLLKELRASVHAGHSGAWPCRIRFSDSSCVDLSGYQSLVTHEFSAIVRDRFVKNGQRHSMISGISGLPLGNGSEAAVGLNVLSRVA